MTRFNRLCAMPTVFRALDETEGGAPLRVIEGVASTPAVDRYQERIHMDALERSIPTFLANAQMPYAHDAMWPIGQWTHAERQGDAMFVRGEIMPAEDEDELVERVWTRINRGLIKTLSIGFNADWRADGAKDDTGHFVWGKPDGSGMVDWVETSPVPIAANPEAVMAIARGLGVDYEQPWMDAEDAPAEQPTEPPSEDERFLTDLTRAKGALEANRNITRAWRKAGRVLSPAYSEDVYEALYHLRGIAEDIEALQPDAEPDPAEVPFSDKLKAHLLRGKDGEQQKPVSGTERE